MMAVPDNERAARQGRPKDQAKRAAIVAAAAVLFGRQSYDTVTMEAVAAEAGVSKMTVYSHFSDKETLFETIVLSVSDRLLAALPPIIRSGHPVLQRLTNIGMAYVEIVLCSEVVSMTHSLRAAMRTNPTIGKRFYDAGPARVRDAVAAIIQAAEASGELHVDHTERAAEDLISLWSGDLSTVILFGLAAPVTTQEIAFRVRRGTELFMRACAINARGEREAVLF